jgi:hypothetical protein
VFDPRRGSRRYATSSLLSKALHHLGTLFSALAITAETLLIIKRFPERPLNYNVA